VASVHTPTNHQKNPFLIMARERDNSHLGWSSPLFGARRWRRRCPDRRDSDQLYLIPDRHLSAAQSGFLQRHPAVNGRRRYKLLDSKTVSVTVEDSKQRQIFEKDLPLFPIAVPSALNLSPEEAPLGSYNITATIGDANPRLHSKFRNTETEFKVTSKGPKEFGRGRRRKFRFTISAN